MELAVFVYFPEEENQIVEVSENEETFAAFVQVTSKVIKGICEEPATHLFYDSKNIEQFLAQCKDCLGEVYWEKTQPATESKIRTDS